jgi:D-glycero-D-manno-heptose 1,7-bisphosphate phosphatase
MPAAALQQIHHRLRDELASAGARIDLLLACTDPPGRPSSHRKPAPGMLRDAMRRFGITGHDAVMVGDSLRDLEAATAAGARRVLVRTGHGARTQADGIPAAVLPVSVYDDLVRAVDALLGGGES